MSKLRNRQGCGSAVPVRLRCFASTARAGQVITASRRKASTVPNNVEAPDRLCTRSVKHQS